MSSSAGTASAPSLKVPGSGRSSTTQDDRSALEKQPQKDKAHSITRSGTRRRLLLPHGVYGIHANDPKSGKVALKITINAELTGPRTTAHKLPLRLELQAN
jgi:hypothetical protein